MRSLKLFFLILFIPLLASCGSGNKGEAPDNNATGVIPEYQLKALDKAGKVESLLDEAERERMKKMEENDL